VARFRGGFTYPQKKNVKKWHTATSAGYFSPYTCTLNMFNNGTHRGRGGNEKMNFIPYASIRLPSKTFALRAVVLPCSTCLSGERKGKGNR